MDERSQSPSLTRQDLELVSELIDGRLRGRERDEALARVAADAALCEVAVESARYREWNERSRRARSRARRVGWALVLIVGAAALGWLFGDVVRTWLTGP